MAQGLLAFKYEQEKKDTGMTALAGLPLYLDLASAMGTGESIEKHLHIKHQGWTDRQTLLSLIMMNLAGGDCVEDLRKLEGDTGFCEVLRGLEQRGMKRRERRESDHRWRKERSRKVPSASSVFRYLSAFHDADQEKKRVEGKAFIPVPNVHLRGLVRVNADMVGFFSFIILSKWPLWIRTPRWWKPRSVMHHTATKGLRRISPAVEYVVGGAGVGIAYGVSGWERTCRV